MKILFLSDNFPPEVNAPATRTVEHCMEWVKQGHEVTVITGVPNFPTGRVFDGYKNKRKQVEYIHGIKVIRVWTYITANEGFLKRTLDYVSFGLSSFFAGLFIKTDIIIATSPQFFSAIGGRWLSFFKRKKWIMEVRDLWPESIKAVGALDGESLVYRQLEAIEKRMYKSASKIVVVTDTFKKIITDRGINPNKIYVVKNGVKLDKFKKIRKDEELLDELKLRDKFIVGYIGTHGLAHKLDFIIECAAKIKNDKIHFLFLGDGAEKSKILEMVTAKNLKNVTMLPFVSKKEVVRYISITDVALVPLKKSDTFKTVIPSKIFENAAMEKPILLGVEGESKGIIEKYKAGLCFEPENEKEFLEKLNQLVENQDIYKSCQDGCKRLALDFNRVKLANNMLKIIKN
jgi:hypothetical protein